MTLSAVRRRRAGLSSTFHYSQVYELLDALEKIETVVDKLRYALIVNKLRYALNSQAEKEYLKELLEL